ncbi:FLJ37770-like protein [Trichonephila clavipes]|nr:FLJ37770-like protein [Trichonephila clavipes]
MAERTEQRICIKFCFNLGKSCAETIEMLQKAFKDECMGKTQIKEWYGRFKNGRTSVNSDPRSGRPSTGTSQSRQERYHSRSSCLQANLHHLVFRNEFHFITGADDHWICRWFGDSSMPESVVSYSNITASHPAHNFNILKI